MPAGGLRAAAGFEFSVLPPFELVKFPDKVDSTGTRAGAGRAFDAVEGGPVRRARFERDVEGLRVQVNRTGFFAPTTGNAG